MKVNSNAWPLSSSISIPPPPPREVRAERRAAFLARLTSFLSARRESGLVDAIPGAAFAEVGDD